MYEKYTTDAIVIAAYEHGEHDKVFALYTRDFGLVRARASAVRKMESRMRSVLSLFSCASVSLIRGARGWRVAGAAAVSYIQLPPEGVHAYSRVTQLVLRLVRGEEANPYLFDVLWGARSACAEKDAVRIAAAELLCVARVLYALGYLSPQAMTSALFAHAQYEEEDLSAVERTRKDVLVSVNGAIAESQL